MGSWGRADIRLGGSAALSAGGEGVDARLRYADSRWGFSYKSHRALESCCVQPPNGAQHRIMLVKKPVTHLLPPPAPTKDTGAQRCQPLHIHDEVITGGFGPGIRLHEHSV